jgi:hypothetical protein
MIVITLIRESFVDCMWFYLIGPAKASKVNISQMSRSVIAYYSILVNTDH